MIKAGIIGGAGLTGGELIRILLGHPECEIGFVQSNSQAGKPISSTHEDLIGQLDMIFSFDPDFDVDVLFLCLPHGDSKKFMKACQAPDSVSVIDLSQDYRLQDDDRVNSFIYGLTETNRDIIKKAKHVANPGCFATAIQLALLPLASHKLLVNDIHVTAVTGSTGAGQKLSDAVHFTWRNSNVSFYKVFEHQHLNEINQTLIGLQENWAGDIHFVPMRGNFTRGILAGVYTSCTASINQLKNIYHEFYDGHPFTLVSETDVDVKLVVNTNKCILHLKKVGEQLFITSVIDNLIKGASGQAVQNMNLMFGLDETIGLKLKPSAF